MKRLIVALVSRAAPALVIGGSARTPCPTHDLVTLTRAAPHSMSRVQPSSRGQSEEGGLLLRRVSAVDAKENVEGDLKVSASRQVLVASHSAPGLRTAHVNHLVALDLAA